MTKNQQEDFTEPKTNVVSSTMGKEVDKFLN